MVKSPTIALLLLLSYSLFAQDQYGILPPISIHHGVETRSSSCVPSPNVDRPFNPSLSFESQVNTAIEAENRAFGKSYARYTHPNYNSNDAQDLVRKVLKNLREVYASDGISNLDITYDESVIDLAADHNCAMDADDQLCHNCPSDGSFTKRIVDRIGAGCYTSGSENIAFISTDDMESSVLRIIYLMMYADLACCDNGHRENFLNCNFNDNTKLGFEIHRGDIVASNGQSFDAWYMTWDYVTYKSYPNCGTGCNCNISIGRPLCGAPGAVLPIVLSSFTAIQNDCNNVEIMWETASEVNNDYFILERSFDSKQWEEVKIVDGSLNSSVELKYAVEDKLDSDINLVYYRLKQVDLDGASTLSEIISLSLECGPEQINIYPNPTTGKVIISNSSRIKSIEVFDLVGHSVKRVKGTRELSIESLQNGIYIVQISQVNGEVSKKRILKTN